jgi:hypothetical protein
MGGAKHSARRSTLTVDPKLRQTIFDTEQLLKDDEPRCVLGGDEMKLEYYEDDYPKLPDRLDPEAQHSLPRLHEPSALSSMTD